MTSQQKALVKCRDGPLHPASELKRTMGRKRSRFSLAKLASALAMSVSVVGAFQTSLPPPQKALPIARTHTVTGVPFPCAERLATSKLGVATSPEVFLREQVELNPTAPLARPLRGAQTVKRRVPPRITIKSRKTTTPVIEEINLEDETTIVSSPDASGATTLPLTEAPVQSALPPRKKRKKSARETSTMPGFQTGALTGRQKAFRDGIKLVEGQTGLKLAAYVDTPDERKKRRKLNGEAMYKSSASVPDSLVAFANEIHTIERITPKEEIELGEKTQEAIRLQNLHDDLANQFDRPPTDEEWCAAAGKINLEALSQAIEDGLEAKNMLVTSNLRMVQGVVNLYIRNGLGGQYNAGDLMQEGIMALIRAAEKFDPSRGFRFSTYAMYWIRSAVKRSQIVQSRVITVPQRLYENHKRLIRTEKEMRDALGRKPTRKELGDAVGMSEVQVERCITAMSQRCFSLDQGIQNTKKPMDSDRSDTLIDIVESRTDDGEFDKQRRIFLREDLIETLNRHLAPEEAQLLLLRYGLQDGVPPEHGEGPMTIANVSRVVGLKPDKVRRMINKSLKQLQVIIGDEWSDFDREFQ